MVLIKEAVSIREVVEEDSVEEVHNLIAIPPVKQEAVVLEVASTKEVG